MNLSIFLLLTQLACTTRPAADEVAPLAPMKVEPVRSSDWLAALPDTEIRRQVILGCTPCHQLGPPVAYKNSIEDWTAIVTRMKQIDDDLDLQLISLNTEELSAWLHQNSKMPAQGFSIETAKADVRTYAAGSGAGFYHDMTVTQGRAWIADYFGNKLYGIHIETGEVASYDLPVSVPEGKPGGAHQIDITKDGSLYITFTKSDQVIRFDPTTETFKAFGGFEAGGSVQYFVVDADRYIYEDEGGGIWVTHFSREILSRLDPATGEVTTFKTPRTEHLPENGVHLYAAVADSRGRLWYTETHGNRLGVLDPKTGEATEREMPEALVGPKRLAIDPQDRLWIPELATGKISIFDTKTETFVDRLSLPIPGDFPYGIRRNRYTGDMWVTGSGSDSLYRLDPKTHAFTVYRLPHAGAYTRTVSFTEDGSVWTSYASFPNGHTQTGEDAGMVVRLTPRP
jgi:streptogramin lyase